MEGTEKEMHVDKRSIKRKMKNVTNKETNKRRKGNK
jgi:hypothetical protein